MIGHRKSLTGKKHDDVMHPVCLTKRDVGHSLAHPDPPYYKEK
jgi:hypothetical protein